MKRLLGSDSDSLLLSEGYGPMMDEDGAEEELGGGLGCGGGGGGGEKKRRLSAEQVRALEKNFEVENKLEPERKARLAQELGLQPRQVAVWFQNRRARWKTKQLERDYGSLKARYDALRADRDALLLDKESLLAEVKALKSKVGAPGAGVGEESSSFTSVKEEDASPELEEPIAPPTLADDNEPVTVIFTKPDVGSSDSDSSAVVNDADHSPLLTASTATTTTMAAGVDFTHNFYQTLMKVEDSHGFDVDEPCSSFFSDEPPPTLPWYADHWN